MGRYIVSGCFRFARPPNDDDPNDSTRDNSSRATHDDRQSNPIKPTYDFRRPGGIVRGLHVRVEKNKHRRRWKRCVIFLNVFVETTDARRRPEQV